MPLVECVPDASPITQFCNDSHVNCKLQCVQDSTAVILSIVIVTRP
ncbi:unnamed protein product [Leptidea sinapis]|uniref:Uncharacterized protein n=1 Tax=Leptidea sinapis TaxID=189913 RepID=A0A5E4PRL4_9NEOP|nr:unnamed protein product [Leptidea sinapis]